MFNFQYKNQGSPPFSGVLVTNTSACKLVVSLGVSVMMARGSITFRGLKPHVLTFASGSFHGVVVLELGPAMDRPAELTIFIEGVVTHCTVDVVSVTPALS